MLVKLAKNINRKGDAHIKRHGIDDFHKVASDLLDKSGLHKYFDYQEIVETAFNSKSGQNFKNLEFSDLPLTIARGENCFIDLYFWRRRPTVVHNHHFNGAFMCLLGQNLDLEYTYKKTQKLGRFHDLGELSLKQTRKLVPGSIAEISFMDKFIHQNHHQADLTVNLCFRTPQAPKKNLSNYLYSGLRYEKDVELLGRVARLQRFLHIKEFDTSKIKISNDDAISFLIQTFDTSSENKRLLNLQKILSKKVKDELGIDVARLMRSHETEFDKIESEYE